MNRIIRKGWRNAKVTVVVGSIMIVALILLFLPIVLGALLNTSWTLVLYFLGPWVFALFEYAIDKLCIVKFLIEE